MTSKDTVIAPFKSKKQTVKKSWIDYNGHMNVAYYTFAFDKAIDEFLEFELGIGPSSIRTDQKGSYALQTQYRYLQELLKGEDFYVSLFLADFTSKTMHVMSEMIKAHKKEICATCETVMANVDLTSRRACKYSDSVYEKLVELYVASNELRLSTKIGQPIGLRKSN